METINLLDYKDFKPDIKADGEIRAFEVFGDMSSIIVKKLIQGQNNNKLIYTQDLRGVGKTHELIKFAKIYGYWVVEFGNTDTQIFRDKYGYEHIYSQMDSKLYGKENLVVDECVNIDKLIEKMHCKIITGFTDKQIKVEKKEAPFTEQTINILKGEAKLLDEAKIKALESGRFSDYKLLIANYKQVIELIQELEGKQTPTTINYNMGDIKLENITNVEDFVKGLKECAFQHVLR